MIKKTIKYLDYNDQEHEDDFYFNLNKSEVVEFVFTEGGEDFEAVIQHIIKEKDYKKIIEMFKEIVLKSYGEKSVDGKRFIKTKEKTEAFSQTEAYVELFMELASNPDVAAAFINGISPKTDK